MPTSPSANRQRSPTQNERSLRLECKEDEAPGDSRQRGEDRSSGEVLELQHDACRARLLDAVLADRNFAWLGTEFDKRSYFMRLLQGRVELREFPRLTFASGPTSKHRYFPDNYRSVSNVRGRTTCSYISSRAPSRWISACSSCAIPRSCGY